MLNDTTGTKIISLYDSLDTGYFSKDSLLCTSQVHSSSTFGVAGNPMVYSVRGDNMITIILISSFIVFLFSTTHSGEFFKQQFKHLFFSRPADADTSTDSVSGFKRFLPFIIAVYCLLLGISSYLWCRENITEDFIYDDHFIVVSLLSTTFLGYFLGKWIIQAFVNRVFFGSKKTLHWLWITCFLATSSAILIYPIVLLQVYFDLSMKNALICFVFILILNKLLTFYKCWLIFFKQNGLFLQTFLYFCALEIIPLLAFGGLWIMIVNFLKVNF